MSEIEELKYLLKELSKKDINLLVEAWQDCIKQGYLNDFPLICKKSFEKDLIINDYEEYIFNENENIEDRYAKYWRMMFELSKKDFDIENKTKKIYRKLLEESLKTFSLDLIKKSDNKKNNRIYLFINQYLPKTNHAPSIQLEKIYNGLKKEFKEIYIISTTPYPFPYPENNFKRFNTSGIEENTLYKVEDKIFLIEFRGYISESRYIDFITEQKLSNQDKFMLIGHSSLHFDILPYEKKIILPTTTMHKELTNARNIIFPNSEKMNNIFNKKMNLMESTGDFTKELKSNFSPKIINLKKIVKIAIVGNRLDYELDKEFFLFLLNAINSIPTIKFVIIGDFSKIELIPHNLIDKLDLIGFSSNLLEYFEEHIHFFLNPDREGGGQSAIYALKLGIPIITLPKGDVFSNIYNKYYINNFNEISIFIKEYAENINFKNQIDSYNLEIVNSFDHNFNKLIQNIILL